MLSPSGCKAETLLTIQRLEAEIERSNAESVDAHDRWAYNTQPSCPPPAPPFTFGRSSTWVRGGSETETANGLPVRWWCLKQVDVNYFPIVYIQLSAWPSQLSKASRAPDQGIPGGKNTQQGNEGERVGFLSVSVEMINGLWALMRKRFVWMGVDMWDANVHESCKGIIWLWRLSVLILECLSHASLHVGMSREIWGTLHSRIGWNRDCACAVYARRYSDWWRE